MNNLVYMKQAIKKAVVLNEPLAYENDLAINKVWYTADADLIEQVFKKLNKEKGVADGRFWNAAPSEGLAIRKIHSGLPHLIVSVLSDIIISDFGAVTIEDEKLQQLWQKIEEDLEFKDLIQGALCDTLVDGDGAFKIVVNRKISEFPLVIYYSGAEVETDYIGNKVQEVRFFTEYLENKKNYVLQEAYGHGYISYELFYIAANGKRKTVPLDTLAEVDNIIPVEAKREEDRAVLFLDNNQILAVPMKFWNSPKYKGRGRSIYDGKTEIFDRYDEAISAFADFERDNRVKNYIPSDLIERDANNGNKLKPNPFNHRFIEIEGGLDLDKETIKSSEMVGDYNAHIAAIDKALEQSLQGIVSPATLGINIAADSSGESQQQKKDMTAITRNHITTRLERFIKSLVKTVVGVYIGFNEEVKVDFGFGEYGALDFGTKIATLAIARPGLSLMSNEAVISEIWGDSKTEEWKKEELERLNQEQNAPVYEATPFPDDLDLNEYNISTTPQEPKTPEVINE